MRRWEPNPALGVDADALREAVTRAAVLDASWLRHPCVSPVTRPTNTNAVLDLGCAAWVAANTDDDLGSVSVPRAVALWSGAGDLELDPGRYSLDELGSMMLQPAPVPVALDVWCRTSGDISGGSWSALPGVELDDRFDELSSSIVSFLRVVSSLRERCPALLGWIIAATRVVRPLVPVPNVARSCHDPDVPGLVEADVSRGPTQTVELLVHETAHLHLRAAQAAGELVEPGHQARYRSPLRTEPRPLMGLVLAYHALAYICAALSEAAAHGVIDQDPARAALADSTRRRDDARAILDGARGHLTDAGAQFVDRTSEVVDHVGR